MQIGLPLIGVIEPPKVYPRDVVCMALTYRQAVRLAWQLRRVRGMTRQQLAAEAGLYASHITDYLNEDDAPSRRDLPAKKIPEVESALGNRILSQWMAMQSELTVLEEMQADRERLVA
jgi:hypothetical protein